MAHTPLDRQTQGYFATDFRPRHGALQHARPSNAASSVPTDAATLISYSISNIWWWYVLVLYDKVTKSLPPRASFPWLTFRLVEVSKVGRRWTPKMDGFKFKKWPDWWSHGDSMICPPCFIGKKIPADSACSFFSVASLKCSIFPRSCRLKKSEWVNSWEINQQKNADLIHKKDPHNGEITNQRSHKWLVSGVSLTLVHWQSKVDKPCNLELAIKWMFMAPKIPIRLVPEMDHRINRMMDLMHQDMDWWTASKAPTFKQIRFCFVSAWNGRLRMQCKKSSDQVTCLVGWMNCTVSSGWIMSNQWNPPTVNVISLPRVETHLAGLFEWSRMSGDKGQRGQLAMSQNLLWTQVIRHFMVYYD